jgi:putative membrane protein
VLIVFSAFCFAAAVWRELKTGAPPPKPDTQRLSPALLILVNGFLVVVDIAALIGIWLARD